MIIRNLKRKAINIGVSLIVIGFIISMIGFGIGGFYLTPFKSSGTPKWYKTINIDEQFSSFTIDFR